jgi:hypothetical protein
MGLHDVLWCVALTHHANILLLQEPPQATVCVRYVKHTADPQPTRHRSLRSTATRAPAALAALLYAVSTP